MVRNNQVIPEVHQNGVSSCALHQYDLNGSATNKLQYHYQLCIFWRQYYEHVYHYYQDLVKIDVNFCQELPPLLLGDTPLKDSGSAFLVELPFVNFIGLRTPDNAASLVLIFWELLPIKVGQEWFGPRGNDCHNEVGRWCYFGG